MADKSVDVVIIGSGIAGLMTAHLLADHLNVIIITKSQIESSNSSFAQGGIAAAIGTLDHWKKHLKDTVESGQDHHKLSHVEMIVKQAPAVVARLQEIGVAFDCSEDGSFLLGMEGAHQERRIVHAQGDQTGRAFTQALIKAVTGRVAIYDQTMAVSLICAGDDVIGVRTKEDLFYAQATVLATGGAGQLYNYTSNVQEATGDGIALAYRAGAAITDMEFVQFHPTLFIKEGKSLGLISEAVRGEGAYLVTSSGKRLMKDHPLKDLAPRDVVSRAIQREINKGNEVFLNCRHIKDLHKMFPSLYSKCQQAEINHETIPIPVAPGAHFFSGGIETNQHGQSSLNGLYAVGEAACTGVHGANRLASNSLLEGLVFAEQAAKHILKTKKDRRKNILTFEAPTHKALGELPTKEKIKEKMTRFVGIERNESGLKEMERWLNLYVNTAFDVHPFESRENIEIKNMIVTAWLMTTSALARTESRGGHYRKDYPLRNDVSWSQSWLIHSREKGLEVSPLCGS